MSTDPPDRLEWWIPRLMVLLVLAVAVFAFVQSYSHIYNLGLTHHQAGLSLKMLPLSVDWLMLAAGLVMLHLNRKGIRHWGPRAALALGATATLTANIADGIIWGWSTAAVNSWAPVVLFTVIELGMLVIRKTGAKPKPEPQPSLAERYAAGALATHDELAALRGDYLAPKATDLRPSQGTHDPSPETATFPRQVDSPEPQLAGWGQLAGQEPAEPGRPGLNGIGLRNGSR